MSSEPLVPPAGRPPQHRIAVLLIVVAALGLPAFALHVACVGRSCERTDAGGGRVPFCSLDDELRARIVTGFQDGRSPDALAVTRTGVRGATVDPDATWPSTFDRPAGVPLAFFGAGIDASAAIPERVRLDRVAPTIAEIMGLDRPHPEVRSGDALAGVATGEPTRLVLEIVLKDADGEDVASGPFLGALEDLGPATRGADPGSLPLDPAAVTTTIGTGGIPRQHGITGSLIRDDDGALVRAWSRTAPPSVIATLADDLDEANRNAARIGLIGTVATDRGLIGGDWYVNVDRDDVVIVEPGRQVAAVREVLGRGYGADEVPDLLAVVLEGDPEEMDAAAERIAGLAQRAAPGGATIVVVGTGAGAESGPGVHVDGIVDQVGESLGADVVEGTVPGGFFIDQDVLAQREMSEDDVMRAIRRAEGPGDRRVFADVFPAISVSFARYC